MIMFQIDVDGIAFCPPKRDPPVSADIDCIATFAQVLIEPVTEILARLARDAYRDFGKASGLPAGLNFGDCFSYALAKVTGEALLLKGADFGPMDIVPAIARGSSCRAKACRGISDAGRENRNRALPSRQPQLQQPNLPDDESASGDKQKSERDILRIER
jgi:uncharacterized protein with PIN domain